MIRRQLPERIRNKCHLLRLYFQYQVDKFLFRTITFDVKFCGDDFFYFPHIVITNVSLVRAGMDCYPIRAETLRVNGGFYYIRIVTTPRVAECRKFVDVDRKLSHGVDVGVQR